MPLLSPENRLAALEASYGIAPPPGATLDSRTANLEFQLGVVPPGIQSRDNRLAQLEAATNRRIIAQLNAGPITIIPNGGANFDTTFRLSYTTGPSAVSALQMVFSGFTLNIPSGGEIPVGNDVTYKASVEFGGTTVPVFFPGGSRFLTVPSGANALVSLPLQLSIPANTAFFVRVEAKWVGTGVLPETEVDYTHTYLAGDQVDITGALVSSTSGEPGPVMILGILTGVTKPTIIMVGDSIAEGYYTGRLYYVGHNGTGDTTKNRGFIRAALGTSFSTLNVACPGEAAQQFVTGGAAGRQAMLTMAQGEYAICNYGSNDLYGAPLLTDVQTEAVLVQTWKALQARTRTGVFQCTVTPRTSSTDAWATTTNQTILNAAQNTARVNVNTWLRAGAPLDPVTLTPVASGTPGAVLCNSYNAAGTIVVAASGVGHPLAGGGIFDSAALAESALNSGLWATGPLTTDGVHPTALGVTTMAPAIRTALLV